MLLSAIISKLHSKACCKLIIYFIKCSLIFQDSNNSSYMRSGDMTHLPRSLIQATLTTFVIV